MEHGMVVAFLDFGKDLLEIGGHKPKPVGIVMYFPSVIMTCSGAAVNKQSRIYLGFPGGSVVKNPPANAEVKDVSLIPGLGRSPGGGNSNPLQYACLENPVDRGAWWVTKSRTEATWQAHPSPRH